MKKIINNPQNIVDEMLKGMVAAHPQYVKRVEGYEVLVRANGPQSKVVLVSGGGSGHEPAHGGFVGKGVKNYTGDVMNFEMAAEVAGFSISVIKLDSELKDLLFASVDTPALVQL